MWSLVAEQPVPSATSAVAHYVTDDEMGAAAAGGSPQALCGQVFRPACLLTPIDRTCSACAAAAATVAEEPVRRRRRFRAISFRAISFRAISQNLGGRGWAFAH